MGRFWNSKVLFPRLFSREFEETEGISDQLKRSRSRVITYPTGASVVERDSNRAKFATEGKIGNGGLEVESDDRRRRSWRSVSQHVARSIDTAVVDNFSLFS